MDKNALHNISYGVYIVSSNNQGKLNGQIANVVSQVTALPPRISVCINKENLTHQLIQASRVFAVSILEQDTPMEFIGRFGFASGKEIDKFKGIDYKIGLTGAPVVTQHCIGYFECELENSLELETHTIFVGNLKEAQIIKDAEPLTYAYYHQVKKRISPKNAPTYIASEQLKQKEINKMTKYRCIVCGYIYNPEKGDPDSGISPGISFQDLPDDWICPVCGVGKDQFEPA